ncbi:MAG: hypothetical protein LBI65_03375 [Candidatus Symbiothrix sp.]|nr:hypothetical protein [Candidatus Symbiothrix sp.]
MKQDGVFTAKLIACISQRTNPRDYLVKKLGISSVSAYRRMRSEILFSFDEAVDIALEMGFSLDEITETSKYPFLSDPRENDSPYLENVFLEMLQEYNKYLKIIANASHKVIQASMSNLNFFLIAEHENLFKLFYFKWIYPFYNNMDSQFFSRMKLPGKIEIERQSILSGIQNYRSIDFIIDENLFFSVIREIRYFHHRKLISGKEVEALKTNLSDLLNRMENRMQGVPEDSVQNFYLSLLSVESSSICAAYDQSVASLYWLPSGKAMIVQKPEICYMHKRWLASQKKSAVLISGSNEMKRIEFIDQQRKYIESITDRLQY